jgi:Terminase large subunit, T4likevirus-type, N-terminal/Terminase RNaseH-like domain
MKPRSLFALGLDPGLVFRALGQTADAWQRDLLFAPDRQILLNCCRQAGKSTTVAALAIHTALFQRGSLILILSPTQRQSHELFRKILDAYNALGRPIAPASETLSHLELANGSRIVALPGREHTVRSFSRVALLIIDEASRVPDDLYRSVRPMLAVSQGRLVALSTPFGRRGFFYEEWIGSGPWKRIQVSWRHCPRIDESFIVEERRALGDAWVRQEYECEFTAMVGLVYPDFASCIVDGWPEPAGKAVGGIDFGWRNPFAAIWGVHDRDDVLWIAGERYLRETPLHEHAAALKQHKQVMWYADPAGATEIAELRTAGLLVRKGDSSPGALRLGIAAVTARIATGRLKIARAGCPNLIAEAQLYRYPSGQEPGQGSENPLDAHNHALAALRYLVSRLDERFIARLRGRTPVESHGQNVRTNIGPDRDDERLWTHR